MGIVLLGFGAITLTAMFVSLRRARAHGGFGRVPSPDPAHAPQKDDYQLELKCGARVNGLNVSWPLATLLVSRKQAELQVWATEPIRITRDEVTGLRWVGAGLYGPGLKFRTESGRLDKVTVWVSWKVPAKLGELGWN